MSDIIFHVLDIQSCDIRIESEQDDVREVVYESYESDDDIPKNKPKNTCPKEFVIHLFGTTENGTSVRCDVTGFRPTIYLRLPENKTSSAADAITRYINSKGIPMGQLNVKRITKKVFYGFTANTFYPFLQIDVPSLALFRTIRYLFLDEHLNPHTKLPFGFKVEVFESNIDPMLRFIHTQNIQPCGWVCVKNGVMESGVMECNYKDVIPTKGPIISAPFLTASWDIECLSMTGDFPVAKRTWRKTAKDLCRLTSSASTSNSSTSVIDLIINSLSDETPNENLPKGMTPIYCKLKKPIKNIRDILMESNISEMCSKDSIDELEQLLNTLKSSIYLVGDPVIQIGTTLTRAQETEQHLFVFPDCDPIPGITVHSYKTEKEMILAWFEWMVQMNPDILIGYNIFGFDESYLWHRAEELKLVHGNSPIHRFTRLFELSSEVKLEEKFLSSSAMGDNRMYIWSLHGRLQIDLFHYIKRNNTLPSYKLDEVTKHFMSGKIKNHRFQDGKLYLDVAGAIKDVKPGRAITLLDDTGETVSEKLVVESVEGNTIIFHCEDVIMDATKWVIVKDDVSPQDIFRLHRESSAGRAIVGKYCLQDCLLVLELYKKLETFNNSMCMANVCSVPIGYIFTRGQGIKIESLIFKACRERDILIPVLSTPTENDDSFEGAIVLDPTPGFYSDSPVGVCDFASLYPSSIVSENISHDSLLWIKDFRYDGTLISHNWGSEVYDECDGYAYTDIEFDIWRPDPNDKRKNPVKIKCGRRICRYAQPLDGTKSTLPQITMWLLQARDAKKKEMKGEKDPERYALLDAEQLAYKLTGNSLYGQLGSPTFKIRLQALAASITAYGRKQLLFARDAIDKFYGNRCEEKCMAQVVYGDSVTGDTPVLIKFCSLELQIPIQGLFTIESNTWIKDGDKEYYELNYVYSWTELGWTKVHRIIRHKCSKKVYRVKTLEGHIDVTEDHSLLNEKGVMIKPGEIRIGSRLLSTKFLDGDIVCGVEEIQYNGYVYDLTTDNHHFQAGPEGLIVHNTDSLFVEFNPKDSNGNRLTGREARQATIDLTDEAGAFITKVLAAPHDFEFDKAFDPLLMFSKKRYAGNMYENNADDYVHKYMGIALKRRDNAPIVKTIFGGAMQMLLDKRDVSGAFRFVKDKCLELVDGKVSLGQLTVTKSLRADYANPSSIAHKVLADRITQRDPGNAPASGDRIGYVYIVKPGDKLQGERIETPLFVKENNLIPDYRHYIEHQLQNPISQAFGLLLEKVPGFNRSMIVKCPDMSNLDGWLGFRENVATQLLFSDCLKKFETSSRHNAIYTLFKGNAVIESVTIKNEPKPIKRPKVSKQTQISSFLYDSMIVNDIKKERMAATAAKKRLKEMEL